MAISALEFSGKGLTRSKVSKDDIRKTIGPIKEVHWPKATILTIGSRPINTIMQRLRGANISPVGYSSLQNILTDPIKVDNISLELWALWGELLLKYGLYKSVPHAELRSMIPMMSQGQIKTPLVLADIGKREACALSQSLYAGGVVTLLWQCDKFQFDYPPGSTTKHFHKDPKAMPRLLEKIKGEEIDTAPTAVEFANIATILGLPTDFDRVTPVSKVKFLQRATGDRPLVTRYLAVGSEINIIGAVKASPPSVRSGVSSYAKFCKLVGRPTLPPTEDASRLWSATFKPDKTYGKYLDHQQKASLLMAHDMGWLTPAARSISNGMETHKT